jgi:tRNA pseudouridine32 synthase / 23S rRNA pseudouridine746 synthase
MTYWYEGTCPNTGNLLRLPRTAAAEAVARSVWEALAADADWPREGKMYGALLAVDTADTQQIFKAFSGLIRGEAVWPGWVPPLPGRSDFAAAEVDTLIALETLKQELIQLKSAPIDQEYAALQQACANELATLDRIHAERKQERDRQREASKDLQLVNLQLINDRQWQSRQDGADRRRLKQQHQSRLAPFQQVIRTTENRIQAIKQERRRLSQQLQLQMHQAYQLTNFLGLSTSLRSLMPQGAPTGTGECCAPKLLHHAAVLGLQPIAMAEFWWGESKGDRQPEQFYGACETRCQPIMGFLLAGTKPPSLDLSILYEDDTMLAIDKPSGLLSVPGRGRDRMDSAWTRLQAIYPHIQSVHRLDQDTSGILLLAKNADMQRELRRCFEQRSVEKAYEAVVCGVVEPDEGTIDLPLWGDPNQRPRQVVDPDRGKAALTKYQVLDRAKNQTRLAFYPVTGRTHQLRVHAAIGLGYPILGDRLYGLPTDPQRLHLHARLLALAHPLTGQPIRITASVPF